MVLFRFCKYFSTPTLEKLLLDHTARLGKYILTWFGRNVSSLKLCELTISQQTEWACPSCTFINKPSRPGCEICATARPDTHIQQVQVHKHLTISTSALLFLTFSLSDRLFSCLIFSHTGARKERGSRRVWFKQQQLTAHHCCLVAVSHLLTHAYTHTRSEDAKCAMYMWTKYSHKDCQVHWESSDSWTAAEDVWSTVAWRRAALAEAQTTNCRQECAGFDRWTWPWHTFELGLISLFILQGMCGADNRDGLIFILGEREVTHVLCIWRQPKTTGTFQFLPTVKWEERWSLVQYPVLFVSASPAGAINNVGSHGCEERVCLQGCQVLLFFYNIVSSVLFLNKLHWVIDVHFSGWSNFTQFWAVTAMEWFVFST